MSLTTILASIANGISPAGQLQSTNDYSQDVVSILAAVVQQILDICLAHEQQASLLGKAFH
jgi:hypothetical protein